MTKITQLIIISIPITIYLVGLIFIKGKIKVKIIDTTNRKKYTKVLLKHFNVTFTPLLTVLPIIFILTSGDFVFDINFVLKIIAFITALVVPFFSYKVFLLHYKNLKHLDNKELMDTVQNE
ncbi:MAG: hypothetical protein KGZ37_02480 [Nitrosarchaeum sp.]|nr:hypothetical protein [Nitrosarchaeum sp.]